MAARPPAAALPWPCAALLFAAALAQRVSPPAVDATSGEPWLVTVRNVTVTNPGSTSLTVQVRVQYGASAASSRRLTGDDGGDSIAPIGPPPDPGHCAAAHRLLIKMSDDGSAGGGQGRRLQADQTLGIKSWQELQNVGIHVAEIGCGAAGQAKSILGKVRSQYGDAIEFAELDAHVMPTLAAPNDPYWFRQWGPARAKVQTAWDRIAALGGTPRRTVVAVIDTGVRYDHEDLVDQMWSNPGEIAGNGIDDDGNGFVDDVFGYDFQNNDADPMDDAGHGTHCAGIVAATADNGKGVAGTAGRMADVKIMALKFLGSSGGYVSNALRALDYAIAMGVPISSNSYGGGGAMQSFQAALSRATAQGHLFVVAAGNEATNIDTSSLPFYPCSYQDTLCVAATTSGDDVAAFSNTGPQHVQIAAPGAQIYSTYFSSTSSYTYLSGTSMATPGVAGAAALVWSNFELLTGTQIGQMIQDSAEKTSWLAGVVASGGVLDVARLEQLAEASSWVQIQAGTGPAGQSLNLTLPPLGSATVRVLMGGRSGLPEGNLSALLNFTSVLSPLGTAVPVTYRVAGWPVLAAPWSGQKVVQFDFGRVGVGSVTPSALAFQNSGNGTLYLRVDRPPAPFLSLAPDLVAVPPGGSGSVAFACAPNASGAASATVVLHTSSGVPPYQGVWANATSLGTKYAVLLACTGQDAPDLAVWPASGASVLNPDGSAQLLQPSVGAQWEGNLSGTGAVAPLVLPSAANPTGCAAHSSSAVASKVILLSKGTCSFGTQALMAQAAGATGILIIDDTDATTTTQLTLAGGEATPRIPAFLLSLSVGQALSARLSAAAQLTAKLSWGPVAVTVGGAGTVNITNRGRAGLRWHAAVQVPSATGVGAAELYRAILPTSASPPAFEWATFSSSDLVSFFSNRPDDDGYYYAVPPAMGAVPFYGQLFSTVMISSNGLLTFGRPAPYTMDSDGLLPDPAAPYGGVVAPFWADLVCNANTKVYAGVQSVNGSKALIIQYQNIAYFGTATTQSSSFEVRLYETGRITMSYSAYDAALVASRGVKVGLQSLAGQGFDVRARLPFAGGGRFTVAFEPLLSPLGPTDGNLAPGQSASYTFTLRASERPGYILVNATDNVSGFWTASRMVRVVPVGGGAEPPTTTAPPAATPPPVTTSAATGTATATTTGIPTTTTKPATTTARATTVATTTKPETTTTRPSTVATSTRPPTTTTRASTAATTTTRPPTTTTRASTAATTTKLPTTTTRASTAATTTTKPPTTTTRASTAATTTTKPPTTTTRASTAATTTTKPPTTTTRASTAATTTKPPTTTTRASTAATTTTRPPTTTTRASKATTTSKTAAPKAKASIAAAAAGQATSTTTPSTSRRRRRATSKNRRLSSGVEAASVGIGAAEELLLRARGGGGVAQLGAVLSAATLLAMAGSCTGRQSRSRVLSAPDDEDVGLPSGADAGPPSLLH